MSRVPLVLACGDYDRTRALVDGTVRPAGIDLTYLRLPVEDTFFRMIRHREFDAAEMSLSSYLVTLRSEEDQPSPFVALPVFTSRMFRHSSVYVSATAGIGCPADLPGRVIGTPEYQLTAGVWMRGILADHYGVPINSVTYRTGGQETPGRVEKAPLGELPVRILPIDPAATLSSLLVEGRIDALCTPRVPSPFVAGDPRVRRLWLDTVAVERAYWAATRIFPIMHVVVLRRDIYERHRWIARSLYDAFCAARRDAVDRLYDTSALRFMLPWLNEQWEEARAVLGDDFWTYGVERNRHVLETFLRYHHEQGLSVSSLRPEDLFVPETAEQAVI